MDDHTLLIILTVLVAIVAVSFLAQAIALVGVLFVARDVRTKIMSVWPQIESIIGTSRRTVDRAENRSPPLERQAWLFSR
jgi:hypothetical protein